MLKNYLSLSLPDSRSKSFLNQAARNQASMRSGPYLTIVIVDLLLMQ